MCQTNKRLHRPNCCCVQEVLGLLQEVWRSLCPPEPRTTLPHGAEHPHLWSWKHEKMCALHGREPRSARARSSAYLYCTDLSARGYITALACVQQKIHLSQISSPRRDEVLGKSQVLILNKSATNHLLLLHVPRVAQEPFPRRCSASSLRCRALSSLPCFLLLPPASSCFAQRLKPGAL